MMKVQVYLQASLPNAKVNVRQHCVSLSCLPVCNSLSQIEWVADLSQHLGSKVTHFRVNEMPITDYVLEYNNFSLGDEDSENIVSERYVNKHLM